MVFPTGDEIYWYKLTDEKATNAKNKNMWVIVENDFAILKSIQLYKWIPRPTVNVWYKSVLEKKSCIFNRLLLP